jgi:hypothetical protein
MANVEYIWTKTETPIRISEYANYLGFNLGIISNSGKSKDIREQINQKIRNSILSDLDDIYLEERDKLLSDIYQGVYVITLSDNLSIDYNGKPSKVLYIGRGKIRERIKMHISTWIYNFYDSLQDISFDIWMTEIKVNGSKDAYKEVESDLLGHFKNKFGSYPLQNSISGKYHEKIHDYHDDWNLPLRNPKDIQNGWSIKPLNKNPWAIKFDEE